MKLQPTTVLLINVLFLIFMVACIFIGCSTAVRIFNVCVAFAMLVATVIYTKKYIGKW